MQGRTAVTQRLPEQRRLAAAVRIDLPDVFPVPLRITSIPLRFRAVDGSIDLVGPYGARVTVDAGPSGDESRTQLGITITPGARIPVDIRDATPITVDGRPGLLRDGGEDVEATVRIGGNRVSFVLSGPDGGKAVLSRILNSVRWSADPTDTATWVDGRTLLP